VPSVCFLKYQLHEDRNLYQPLYLHSLAQCLEHGWCPINPKGANGWSQGGIRGHVPRTLCPRHFHSAIPHPGIHPKELKAGSQRDIWTPVFTAASFTIAKR